MIPVWAASSGPNDLLHTIPTIRYRYRSLALSTMPASEPQVGGRGRQLLTVLFWIGVALAPLAALTLLLGRSSGPLRIAAVLAILSVVLIGLSLTMRRDAEAVRLELEETILDEADLLRADLREEVTAAVQNTESIVQRECAALRQEMEALRGQLANIRTRGPAPSPGKAAGARAAANPAGAGPRRAANGAGGRPAGESNGGRPRAATAPAAVASPSPSGAYQQYSAPPANAPVSGAYQQYSAPPANAPVSGAYRQYSAPPANVSASGAYRQYSAPPADASASGAYRGFSGGVVRHTETVQVTTRQTTHVTAAADQNLPRRHRAPAEHDASGTVYGGVSAEQDDRPLPVRATLESPARSRRQPETTGTGGWSQYPGGQRSYDEPTSIGFKPEPDTRGGRRSRRARDDDDLYEEDSFADLRSAPSRSADPWSDLRGEPASPGGGRHGADRAERYSEPSYRRDEPAGGYGGGAGYSGRHADRTEGAGATGGSTYGGATGGSAYSNGSAIASTSAPPSGSASGRQQLALPSASYGDQQRWSSYQPEEPAVEGWSRAGEQNTTYESSGYGQRSRHSRHAEPESYDSAPGYRTY